MAVTIPAGKKRNIIIGFAAAVILLLAFSTRTSPLYNFLMGNYTDNYAAEAMLAGKCWLQGMIPYRDLFITEGPVYLLIQAVAYGLAGRYALLVLQIINLGCFMTLVYGTTEEKAGKKAAVLCLVFCAFAYAALCSGGDSAVEWTLALGLYIYLQAAKKEISSKKAFLLGLLSSCLLLTSLSGSAIAIGAVIYLLTVNRQGKGKSLLLVLGFVIPIAASLIYFAACGALREFFSAAVLMPLKLTLQEAQSASELIHKLIKCLLLLIPFAAALFVALKKKDREALCLLYGAGLAFIFNVISCNYWCYYLAALPLLVIAFGCVGREKMLPSLVLLAVAAVIMLIPAKNYLSFLIYGTNVASTELGDDLASYRSSSPEASIYMLDTDSTYYLSVDAMPEEKYFYNQTALSSCDADIYDEINTYLAGEDKPDCIVKTVFGQYYEEGMEGYSLVQAYIKHYGNVQIYLADEE